GGRSANPQLSSAGAPIGLSSMLEGPILPDRVRTARRMLQQSIGDHGALTFLELELAKSRNKACKYLVPFDSNDRAIRTNSGPPYIS
ncbi:hypothetical protein NQ246_26660, partial [Escherichia coli]|nr:hypothetical protein [Escherichia coli]